jgi:hypothetical protein
MAQPLSNTQFPLPGIDVEMFQKGVEKGREFAVMATRRVAAWAEENPGQMVLAGLALGFVLGKLLFRSRRAPILDVE